MGRPLTDFRVLTFDCYGTLIDWETGIWDALQPLIGFNGGGPDRAVALAAFGELEAAEERRRPGALYPQVLAAVHRRLAERFGLATSDALEAEFGSSVPHWPAFSDSAEALRALKAQFRLVILSNVHRAGISASIRKLGVQFDAVHTAEDIGSYKPDPRNFDYLLSQLHRELGLGPDDVLHTAQSLYHDHVPAKEAGLATAWIDRQRLSAGGLSGATAMVAQRPQPDYVFYTLAELANGVQATR